MTFNLGIYGVCSHLQSFPLGTCKCINFTVGSGAASTDQHIRWEAQTMKA